MYIAWQRHLHAAENFQENIKHEIARLARIARLLCARDITEEDWEIIHFCVPEFPKVPRSPTYLLSDVTFHLSHIVSTAERGKVPPINGQSLVMYNHQCGLTSQIIGWNLCPYFGHLVFVKMQLIDTFGLEPLANSSDSPRLLETRLFPIPLHFARTPANHFKAFSKSFQETK